jgi:hypothetical protein
MKKEHDLKIPERLKIGSTQLPCTSKPQVSKYEQIRVMSCMKCAEVEVPIQRV